MAGAPGEEAMAAAGAMTLMLGMGAMEVRNINFIKDLSIFIHYYQDMVTHMEDMAMAEAGVVIVMEVVQLVSGMF